MINNLREETIKNIFNRYEMEPSHAKQVTKIALIIFDKTKGLIHNLGLNERDLLEAGTLLHDIGYYIAAKGHNKNSYKLIEKETLPGFSEREKEIIGNIARYHRGKMPKSKHSCYEALTGNEKSIVNKLSAFVRVADALDRTHCSVVDNLDFIYDSFSHTLTVLLKLHTPDCSFEILKANDKKDLFEKEFNLELRFEVASR